MHSTVSMSLTISLINYSINLGASPDIFSKMAGLKPYEINNLDARIPLEQFKKIVHAAKNETNTPSLILQFGKEVSVASHSIIGMIMEASSTMGEAFTQLQRYTKLAADIKGVATSPRFQLAEEEGRLLMVDTRQTPNSFPELTEFAFASLACGPRNFLKKQHILSVHVTHAAPQYSDIYETIFQSPVHFNSSRNMMELHPEIAGWPVAQRPKYILPILTMHADNQLIKLENSETIRSKVECFILPHIHKGNPNSLTVANSLGISRQSLYRKLISEGTSFSNIVDEVRKNMAEHYLEQNSKSTKEIAYLLGFSETASFARAFKRWTGFTPGEFRNTAQT